MVCPLSMGWRGGRGLSRQLPEGGKAGGRLASVLGGRRDGCAGQHRRDRHGGHGSLVTQGGELHRLSRLRELHPGGGEAVLLLEAVVVAQESLQVDAALARGDGVIVAHPLPDDPAPVADLGFEEPGTHHDVHARVVGDVPPGEERVLLVDDLEVDGVDLHRPQIE